MSSNFNSNNQASVDVYVDSDNPDSSGSDIFNDFPRDSVDILIDDNNSVAGTSSNLNSNTFIGKKGQVNTDNNDIKNENVREVPSPPSPQRRDRDPQSQQDAFLEIEQVELKSIPKTPRDRLKQRLTDVNQLTFYPGAEIDLGTTPIITALKNETGELILRLEHKSNVVIDEPAGVNMEQISSYFKEDFLDDGRVTGGNASRAVDSRYMKFCDENGRLIFRGICEKQYTAVKCGADVLGYIDGTALEMTSTPNVIAKNVKNEILFEIPINNEKDASLTAPKPQDEVNVYSNNEIIAKMGQSVTEKGTSFGIKFSRDLKGETKAVLITAAFLVYSSIFSKASFGNKDGGVCCCCC